MRTSLLLTAFLLGTGSQLLAQTSTWPVGYRTETWGQAFNMLGLTLQTPTLVQGRVTSSDNSTTPGTTVVFGSGSFTALTSGNTYVFELTSGASKGLVQEFTVFTTSQISVPGTLTLDPEDTYQIRKAPTLEELFGTSTTILTKSLSMTNADVVWVPAGGGLYSKYWIQSSTNTWRDESGNPAPNVPVIYLDALQIQRKAASPTLSYALAGELKKGPTNLMLEQGFNVLSTYSPVGVTLQNFGLEDDIQAGLTSAAADVVWVPTGPSTYQKYFRSSLSGNWKDASTNLDVTVPVPLPNGLLVQRLSATPVLFDSTEAPSDQDSRFSPVGGVSSSLSGTTFQATFPVQKGKTYQPQTSTDRVNWTNLGTASVASGSTLTVTDSSATQSAKLYRVTTGAIRPGFDLNLLARTDDSNSVLTGLGFTVNFFGNSRSDVYVNNNGNITFDADLSDFHPATLRETGYKILAPFWADVDTRPYDGGNTYYGQGTLGGRSAFAVQWRDVGYYDLHTDKKNSFQLVVINRSDVAAGDFDFEFNYDGIQWEEGDASNVSPFDGYSHSLAPRAGVASGSASYFELTGSGVAGKFTDFVPYTTTVNTTGLIYQTLGSTVPGRLSFQSRSGVISQAIVVNAGTDVVTTATSATLSGSVTYSGTTTKTWTQESGPASVIASPSSLSTSVTLPAVGTYTFRLNASTSGTPSFSASDTVTVTRN